MQFRRMLDNDNTGTKTNEEYIIISCIFDQTPNILLSVAFLIKSRKADSYLQQQHRLVAFFITTLWLAVVSLPIF